MAWLFLQHPSHDNSFSGGNEMGDMSNILWRGNFLPWSWRKARHFRYLFPPAAIASQLLPPVGEDSRCFDQ